MLQDLDQLAARIGQMVQYIRELRTERDTLRVRVMQIEQISGKMQERYESSSVRLQGLQEQLQRQDSECAAKLAQAESAQTWLRLELKTHIEARQALEMQLTTRENEWAARLQSREQDLQRLRVTAQAAQARIEAVLARLGAPTEAQLQ